MAAEKWREIKQFTRLYVGVIGWHEDPDDPSAGTIEIMLFE
jgi:hypothetical protein